MTSYDMERMSSSKEIVVSDRRHSAVALRDEVTLVDESVSYDMALSTVRYSLYEDLFIIVNSVFKKIPKQRIYLLDEQDYLLNAIYLLRGEKNSATIYFHREVIQNHLNKLPAILDEILTYSAGGRKMHQELFITWSLRGFIRKLKTLLNRPITRNELNKLSRDNGDLIVTLSAEFAHLGVDSSNPISKRAADNQRNEATKKKAEVQHEKIVLQDWLCNISADLLVAYRETEEIFTEAEALASSPEDEYFLEQVNADYYPHIFESLGKFDSENADFDVKELVVVESIKQFKIIQLGLQKIIDNTVSQSLTTIKAQTDFLRNKVLGERSFSLTDDEAEIVIDSSLEESQRIREELYKKHVAPKLEKNRQEYEKSIADLKDSHQIEYDRLSRAHTQELARQRVEMQSIYGNEISVYKNQARDYKEKYTEHLKSAQMYHHTQMKNAQQSHDTEMRVLQKQAARTAQTAQRVQDAFVNLQEEVLVLKMALVSKQDELDKIRLTDEEQQRAKEATAAYKKIKSQNPKWEKDSNWLQYGPKAELHECPSYYRKASKQELAEIYEDEDYPEFEDYLNDELF